jgi:hypothetical protein
VWLGSGARASAARAFSLPTAHRPLSTTRCWSTKSRNSKVGVLPRLLTGRPSCQRAHARPNAASAGEGERAHIYRRSSYSNYWPISRGRALKPALSTSSLKPSSLEPDGDLLVQSGAPWPLKPGIKVRESVFWRKGSFGQKGGRNASAGERLQDGLNAITA